MRTSQKGIDLIKHYEGLHDGDLSNVGLQPKQCPAGIWTCGYGHAMIYKGQFLKGEENKDLAYSINTITTIEGAEALLTEDLYLYERKINGLGLTSKQNEFSALVSFAYNLGFTNLVNSTLLRRIEMGTTPQLITDAFLMWVKCGGKVLNGLVYRRKSEAHLYNTGELKFYND